MAKFLSQRRREKTLSISGVGRRWEVIVAVVVGDGVGGWRGGVEGEGEGEGGVGAFLLSEMGWSICLGRHC